MKIRNKLYSSTVELIFENFQGGFAVGSPVVRQLRFLCALFAPIWQGVSEPCVLREKERCSPRQCVVAVCCSVLRCDAV